MIPSALVSVILVLAAYRILRLLGWDDFPPVYRARAWAIKETWTQTGLDVHLPGKTPESEVADVRVAYGRPLLAHFVHCPFCLGFWVSCTTYIAWLLAPTATLYVAFPFAVSGAIGLIAKNLDA